MLKVEQGERDSFDFSSVSSDQTSKAAVSDSLQDPRETGGEWGVTVKGEGSGDASDTNSYGRANWGFAGGQKAWDEAVDRLIDRLMSWTKANTNNDIVFIHYLWI